MSKSDFVQIEYEDVYARVYTNDVWRAYRRDDVGSGVVTSAPGGNGGVHMGHAKGLQKNIMAMSFRATCPMVYW